MVKLRIGTFVAPGAAVAGPICWTDTVVRLVDVESRNAVCATKPDAWPTAVTVKLRPTSSVSGANCVLTKVPAASATTEYATSGLVNGACRGGHQASWVLIRTVSPGCQCMPEISTGVPGA